MAYVIIAVLVTVVIWLLISRGRTARSTAILKLRRDSIGSPITGAGDPRAAMLSAVDMIPFIDRTIGAFHSRGIAFCAQGITFMEVASIYLYYAGRYALEHFRNEYDMFMPILSGGIIDHAEHELHWPESSLKEFQQRVEERNFEYSTQVSDKEELVRAFFKHINKSSDLDERCQAFLAKHFAAIQTNVGKLLMKYS